MLEDVLVSMGLGLHEVPDVSLTLLALFFGDISQTIASYLSMSSTECAELMWMESGMLDKGNT